MPSPRISCFALLLSLAVVAAAEPTTIYFNGKVWRTGGDFAEAFIVEGKRIVAVGDDEAIRGSAANDTVEIDLDGKLVLPGFIDNHTHFIRSALALTGVDLRDAATPAEFSRRIAERAREKPGEWITNGDWDHELWGGELPTRKWIDRHTRDTPVFVVRLDGHMGLANSAALNRAGIDAATPDPEGGEIIRDPGGEPTGLLKDTAMSPIYELLPEPDRQDVQEALERGFAVALEHGVTQVHDMSDWHSLESFRRTYENGTLGIRVYAFVPIADWSKMADYVRANGTGDDSLRWGSLKGFVDGSLGSTTAWFHEPYDDALETSGLIMNDPEELAEQITRADRAGLHVAVHAIGDRANDWLLDTFERVARENGARDRRFRIEHAQHLTREAIKRMGQLGVIPSMQPYHAIDDGRWAEKRIGKERLEGTYAFRSLLDAGATLTFGSDWAVAPIDPLTGIDAAVNRRTIDGRNPGGWEPQERIGVGEAITAYTAANAFSGFQDDRLGRIAPGYLADFVVLSEDVFTIDRDRILDVRVLRTVIDGETRYLADRLGGRTEPSN